MVPPNSNIHFTVNVDPFSSLSKFHHKFLKLCDVSGGVLEPCEEVKLFSKIPAMEQTTRNCGQVI